jgi:hypothetical protein
MQYRNCDSQHKLLSANSHSNRRWREPDCTCFAQELRPIGRGGGLGILIAKSVDRNQVVRMEAMYQAVVNRIACFTFCQAERLLWFQHTWRTLIAMRTLLLEVLAILAIGSMMLVVGADLDAQQETSVQADAVVSLR